METKQITSFNPFSVNQNDSKFLKEASLPWMEINCENTGERWLHTSTLYKHYVITYGGFSHLFGKTDIIIFDMETFEWHKPLIEGVQPDARCGHTACLWDNDKIIIFGGSYSSIESNEILIFNLEDTKRT